MENNIVKREYQGKHITLIPTAHVSKYSSELVEATIDEIKPDSICIELDQQRYNSMLNPEQFQQTDIIKIIKEKKVGMLLVNLILSNYQKRIAGKLDSKSGKEMLVGIEKAKELNADLVLADRNIQTTFKRVWAKQGFVDKIKLLNAILSAMFDDEEISEEQLADLQKEDMLSSAMKEVSEKFPKIAEVLVDERDKYLAYNIKHAQGTNIVAILGAAHCINVPKYIQQDYSIDEYDQIPPKTLGSKLIGWLIPALIIVGILLSFKIDASIGLAQIKRFVLFNGSLAAVFTLLCGGHILSIITSFVMAPIAALNPLLATGWFSGIVEAYIRKPTVNDFANMSTDATTLKGFWKNKVTRILLIVLLSSLGSSLGTFVSGFNIFKTLIDKL